MQKFKAPSPGSWVTIIHTVIGSAHWLLCPFPSLNQMVSVEGWYTIACHLIGFLLLDPSVYQASCRILQFLYMTPLWWRTVVSSGASRWCITGHSIFCSSFLKKKDEEDNWLCCRRQETQHATVWAWATPALGIRDRSFTHPWIGSVVFPTTSAVVTGSIFCKAE